MMKQLQALYTYNILEHLISLRATDILNLLLHIAYHDRDYGRIFALTHLFKQHEIAITEMPEDFSHQCMQDYRTLYTEIDPRYYERDEIHIRAMLGDITSGEDLKSILSDSTRDGVDGFHSGRLGLVARDYLAWFHPTLISSSESYDTFSQLLREAEENRQKNTSMRNICEKQSGISTMAKMCPLFDFAHESCAEINRTDEALRAMTSHTLSTGTINELLAYIKNYYTQREEVYFTQKLAIEEFLKQKIVQLRKKSNSAQREIIILKELLHLHTEFLSIDGCCPFEHSENGNIFYAKSILEQVVKKISLIQVSLKACKSGPLVTKLTVEEDINIEELIREYADSHFTEHRVSKLPLLLKLMDTHPHDTIYPELLAFYKELYNIISQYITPQTPEDIEQISQYPQIVQRLLDSQDTPYDTKLLLLAHAHHRYILDLSVCPNIQSKDLQNYKAHIQELRGSAESIQAVIAGTKEEERDILYGHFLPKKAQPDITIDFALLGIYVIDYAAYLQKYFTRNNYQLSQSIPAHHVMSIFHALLSYPDDTRVAAIQESFANIKTFLPEGESVYPYTLSIRQKVENLKYINSMGGSSQSSWARSTLWKKQIPKETYAAALLKQEIDEVLYERAIACSLLENYTIEIDGNPYAFLFAGLSPETLDAMPFEALQATTLQKCQVLTRLFPAKRRLLLEQDLSCYARYILGEDAEDEISCSNKEFPILLQDLLASTQLHRVSFSRYKTCYNRIGSSDVISRISLEQFKILCVEHPTLLHDTLQGKWRSDIIREILNTPTLRITKEHIGAFQGTPYDTYLLYYKLHAQDDKKVSWLSWIKYSLMALWSYIMHTPSPTGINRPHKAADIASPAAKELPILSKSATITPTLTVQLKA